LEEGSAFVAGALFEDVLDFGREVGEVVLPGVGGDALAVILGRIDNAAQFDDVPVEGAADFEVDTGIVRGDAGGEDALAGDELMFLDALIEGVG
jgi:hypothetical protein